MPTEASQIGPDDVSRLVAALVPAAPLLGVTGPDSAAADLGWSLRGPVDDRTVRAWAGADIEPVLSVGRVRRGWRRTADALVAVTVVLDEALPSAGQENGDRILDTFAAAASPLFERFGEPMHLTYGPVREIVWSLGEPTGGPSRRPRRAVLALVAASAPASVRLMVRLAEAAPGSGAGVDPAIIGPASAPVDEPGDWDQFACALAAELVDVTEEREFIVSEGRHDDTFVRFGPLWAETVSSHQRASDRALSAAQEQSLDDLGWARFGSDGDWWFGLQVPWPPGAEDYHDLAGMAVSTLRDVHGVASPADLVLDGLHDPSRYHPRLGLANRDLPSVTSPPENEIGCLLSWVLIFAYLLPFVVFVEATGALLAALTDTTENFVPMPVPVAAAVAAGCYAALVGLTRGLLRRRRTRSARGGAGQPAGPARRHRGVAPPLPVGLAELGTLPMLLLVPIVGVSLSLADTDGTAEALALPVGVLICAALLTTVLRRAPGPTGAGMAGWLAWAALAVSGWPWASAVVGTATFVAAWVYGYRWHVAPAVQPPSDQPAAADA